MSDKKEEIIEIFIDVEEFVKAKKEIPKGRKYLIKIDKAHYKVDKECMTGTEILALADKSPAKYELNVKLHSGKFEPVKPDEEICFHHGKCERFTTLPLDQTEG